MMWAVSVVQKKDVSYIFCACYLTAMTMVMKSYVYWNVHHCDS